MDAALLQEISKLTGAINRHKANQGQPPPRGYPSQRRPYPQHRQYRATTHVQHPSAALQSSEAPGEVIINGVAFLSDPSGRKLTRKAVASASTTADAPTILDKDPVTPRSTVVGGRDFVKTKSGNLVSTDRLRKRRPPPPDLEAKRARLGNMTLVLNNAQAHRNPRRQGHLAKAPAETKPCRYFTRTGICGRGRTCPYVHDPSKVAICPRFLKGDCPNGLSCPLSHEPTPQRMPYCVHFAMAGRCKNGSSCMYPHVHVGASTAVCRDFAIMGFCQKGADCNKNHVRECPDFAEKGVCSDPHCKLPHVIRANRSGHQQKLPEPRHAPAINSGDKDKSARKRKAEDDATSDEEAQNSKRLKMNDVSSFATGAEFISLTIEESSDEGSDEDGVGDLESVDSNDVQSDKDDVVFDV